MAGTLQRTTRRPIAPPMDISETDDKLQIRLDTPGVEPEDIDIQVSGNQLTISGQRKEEEEKEGETFYRVERQSGSFSRSVTLPYPVDGDKIDASSHGGVLTVSLPKCEEAKPRRVEVKSS